MHDCSVRAGGRNRVEADVQEGFGFGPKLFQLAGCSNLIETATRCFPVEPGEKADDSSAVTEVCGTRTLDLDLVLSGLGENAGVLRPRNPLRSTKLSRDPPRSCIWIEPDALPRCLELAKPGGQRLRLTDPRESQVGLGLGIELFLCDEQLRLTLRGHDREGEGNRVVLHVAAADVEQPRYRVRQGQHHGVLAICL